MILVFVAFVLALALGVALRQRVTIGAALLGLALVFGSAVTTPAPTTIIDLR